MMTGPTISPPPISAVQELRALLALAADSKNAGKFLSELEHTLNSISVANHQQVELNEANKKLIADLADKKAELDKLKAQLVAREKDVSIIEAGFSARESMVLASERALDEKQKAFKEESESLLGDLKQRQKALIVSQEAAAVLKSQSEKLINEYNEKSARIKAAVGG